MGFGDANYMTGSNSFAECLDPGYGERLKAIRRAWDGEEIARCDRVDGPCAGHEASTRIAEITVAPPTREVAA